MDVRTPPVPQEMKGAPAGTVPVLPPDQPRVHSSGSARGDACGGLGRREEEQGERGDATDREGLASAPGLLIQLKGLIPEVPRGESGLSEGTRAGSWEGWASLGITDTTAGAAHCPQLRPAHSLSLGPSQPRVPSSAVTGLVALVRVPSTPTGWAFTVLGEMEVSDTGKPRGSWCLLPPTPLCSGDGPAELGASGEDGKATSHKRHFWRLPHLPSWWVHSAPNPVCWDHLQCEDNSSRGRANAVPPRAAAPGQCHPCFPGRIQAAPASPGGKLLRMRLFHLHLVLP